MAIPPSAPASSVAAVAPVARAAAPELVADRVLALSPGQVLAARVVAAAGGLVELAVAGGRLHARTDLPLAAGQTLSLVVDEASDERVGLRVAPAPAGGAEVARPAPGLSAAAGRALVAALADAGVEAPGPTGMAALAARAAAAGVSSPASAAAFARLVAAGLPATPAAVGGLAELVEGPPVGRALAGLLDAATAAAPRALPAGATPPPAPGAAAAPPGAPVPPAGGTAPSPAPAPPATSPAGATPPAAPAPPVPPPAGAAPGTVAAPAPAPDAPPEEAGAAPSTPAAPAREGAGRAPGAAPPLPALVRELTDLVDRVGRGAVSGDAERLRGAVAELGHGLEARLAAGRAPEAAPVRSLLVALASHPAADPALARAASGLADALGAQGLAAAAPAAPPPDPGTAGAYLQVPLPGGQTAEIRVAPDGGGEGGGGDRPRTLAFLLDLSALGAVVIEATAGPAGVDATVRLGAPEARRFVAGCLDELTEALGAGGGRVRVRVEALLSGPPARLIDPPAASGLDLRA